MNIETLKLFRKSVYEHFSYACDAAMNLLDALSSHPAKSVIELSLSPHFKRQHSSIARAIQDHHRGRNPTESSPSEQNETRSTCQKAFLNCLTQHLPQHDDSSCRFLALDVTPQIRPYSKKLKEKEIVHHFTPTPGQKPIAVGHNVSCIGETLAEDQWFLPYLIQRVPLNSSQVEFGILQANLVAQQLRGNIVVASDCKYSTAQAISLVNQESRYTFLARLSPTRVFYFPHEYSKSDITKKGRKTIYGEKFSLKKASVYQPNETKKVQHITKKGRIWEVTIDRFDNLLMQGESQYALSDKPVSVFRLSVTDASSGKAIFNDPLWILGLGCHAKTMDLGNIFLAYHYRFNIEHWFRFSKQNLLFDRFQTGELNHAEDWLLFPLIASHLLYHSRKLAQNYYRPWETKRHENITPAQVKRSMDKILAEVGTPAKDPTTRGIGVGRNPGVTLESKPDQDINFKNKNRKTKGAIITINIEVDDLSQLGEIGINAKNLPTSGKFIKKALRKFFETGFSNIEKVA